MRKDIIYAPDFFTDSDCLLQSNYPHEIWYTPWKYNAITSKLKNDIGVWKIKELK